MAIARAKEVKSSHLFKTCLLGLFTTAGLGLIVIPAYADAVSVSTSENSASVTGSNSVRQSIKQSNSARSDGSDVISIQNARTSGSASGENNHIEQDIVQSSENQQLGTDEGRISRQNAESNAVTSGKNNRIQHRIEQSILQQHLKR